MGNNITTALTSAFSGVVGDVTTVITAVLPIALGLFALIFGIRKAMQFFKSVAKG